MAGTASDESGAGKSAEANSSAQQSQSEALTEWRSSEQVENGITSTSPPYWDTDDEDDGGLKPSELYGKYTWKIEKFSQINKRELRSNAFEVGGYKWYILIYPQGCDVCNHLSLFLCVANHDKLLPGWSHFAQFTIAVVNKDPKKSKYSDTLHRFWKKEHDWGWKKFMELSKVFDGFIDADTLIIKAQVQVIREKANRPFRCLDCQYRRELVRVYLTNVEQICRRFVEERRSKLGRLLDDKSRWSSFSAFWLGIDQNARRRMSREKADSILKVVVKHFFIEKEVTSTLVMDSLYSGLKALEGQTCTNAKPKLLDIGEMPAPMVRVDKDVFVLVDDVLPLLKRAALEPLPPKDDKGPQNRTKDGNSGEDFNKEAIERDERRLTELGRRTVEIFVLAHIFSNKIEVAYQEAVALKRQEELIREEEAAWLAESEQKAKRAATEKDKKLKKKQGKKKGNNRKGKDKGKEERISAAVQVKNLVESPDDENKESITDEVEPTLEKSDMLEDISDATDSVDGVVELHPPDPEDRDVTGNWDTDTSEAHPPIEPSCRGVNGLLSAAPNGVGEKKNASVMDDSSSTCSTDSIPSVVMNGPYKGNTTASYQNLKSPSRGKSRRGKIACDGNGWTNEMENKPSRSVTDSKERNDVSEGSKAGVLESEAIVSSLTDKQKLLEQPHSSKEEQVLLQKKQDVKKAVDLERPKDKPTAVPSSPRSPSRSLESIVQLKTECKSVSTVDVGTAKKNSSDVPQQNGPTSLSISSSPLAGLVKSEIQKSAIRKQTEKSVLQPVAVVSRPSSAPLIPAPRPTAPVVSMVQTSPLLARSVSAAGRLGPDPSPSTTQSYVPQSYRNAIVGNTVGSSSFPHPNTHSSVVKQVTAYSQQPAMVSGPPFVSQSSERIDSPSISSGFSFGIQNGPPWSDSSQRDASRSLQCDPSSLVNDIHNLDIHKHHIQSGSNERKPTEFPTCSSGRQMHGMMADEFPHIDIINDLLDDENGFVNVARANMGFQSLSNGPQVLTRQYTFPSDVGLSGEVGSSNGSSMFERSHSYRDDGFQRSYSSSGNHFDPMMEYIPQATLPYVNGQMDGLMQTQWQMPGSEMSMLGMRNTDGEGYTYYNPDYTNMSCGVNGYTVFRPSTRHQ